jgi:hypothetical protein
VILCINKKINKIWALEAAKKKSKNFIFFWHGLKCLFLNHVQRLFSVFSQGYFFRISLKLNFSNSLALDEIYVKKPLDGRFLRVFHLGFDKNVF